MVVQKQRIKELQSSFEVLKQVSIALPIGLAGLACLWNAPLELQVNFTGCAWVGILGTVLLLAHLRKRITGTSAMSARVAGVLILFSTVMPALWYMFFQFAFNLALAPVMAALQKLDSTPYAAFIYICAYVAITAVVMQMNRVVRAAQLHKVTKTLLFSGLAVLFVLFLPFAWHGLVSLIFACMAGHAYTTMQAEHDALSSLVARAPWFFPLALNMYVTMRTLLGVGTKKRFEADPLIVVMASLAQLFIAVGLSAWPSTMCHSVMKAPGHYLIVISCLSLLALLVFVQHVIHLSIKTAFEESSPPPPPPPRRRRLAEQQKESARTESEIMTAQPESADSAMQQDPTLIECTPESSTVYLDEPEHATILHSSANGELEALAGE